MELPSFAFVRNLVLDPAEPNLCRRECEQLFPLEKLAKAKQTEIRFAVRPECYFQAARNQEECIERLERRKALLEAELRLREGEAPKENPQAMQKALENEIKELDELERDLTSKYNDDDSKDGSDPEVDRDQNDS